MKKAFFVFLIAAFVFSFAAQAQAQAQAQATVSVVPPTPLNRTILVAGDAEVRVVPDQVLISMTAESRDTNLLVAKNRNDQTVGSIVKYVTKTADIKPRHVQTDYVSIEPVYRQCRYNDELSGKCSPLDIIYYKIRKGIQIRLNDPSKYEALITKSLELGVTQINNIQFITTELRKHRDKARELAAKASQEKAQAVAGTLGMKVGKPMSINTQNYYSFHWNRGSQRSRGNYGGQNTMTHNSMMEHAPSSSSGDASGELALGQISISAKVNVTYELE
ncbi:MAG: SIMPL domain-containing protein [Alphaproteobacteria bacterium]|nr:SIMPL domain-containing protein [Alphaproteobacteria bacterium]